MFGPDRYGGRESNGEQIASSCGTRAPEPCCRNGYGTRRRRVVATVTMSRPWDARDPGPDRRALENTTVFPARTPACGRCSRAPPGDLRLAGNRSSARPTRIDPPRRPPSFVPDPFSAERAGCSTAPRSWEAPPDGPPPPLSSSAGATASDSPAASGSSWGRSRRRSCASPACARGRGRSTQRYDGEGLLLGVPVLGWDGRASRSARRSMSGSLPT